MLTHKVYYKTPSGRIKTIKVPRMAGKLKELILGYTVETKTYKSNWNGFGYADMEYTYIVGKSKHFSEISNIISSKDNKVLNAKTEEEIIQEWAKRLSKLTDISLEEAKEIASEKLEYKENHIQMIEDRQVEQYSVQRKKLLNKMRRENPLRRIKNAEHAENILLASKRHNKTNYDNLLEKAREMAEWGDIHKSEIKEFARKNCHNNFDDNK